MNTETRRVTLAVGEYCLLAGVLGATNLIGVDDPWPGLGREQVNKELVAAREALVERGLIEVRADNRIIIEPWLASLVSVCGFPEVVCILTHSLPQYGQAQRYFHLTRQMAVEMGQVRGAVPHLELTAYAEPQAVIGRIGAIFRLEAQARAALPTASLPQQLLGPLANLAMSQGQAAVRQELDAADLAAGAAEALSLTFSEPLQNGSLAVLAPQAGEWQIEGLGLLEGRNALWRMDTKGDGAAALVELTPVSAEELRNAIAAQVTRHLPA